MKLNPCVFSLCVIIAFGGAAFGVPANSKVWTFTQPDGTTFQAVLLGDEFYSYHQTLEGEIILQDRDSGEWFYAELRADGSLQKTPARVGQDRLVNSALNRGQSQWPKALQEAADRRASEMRSDSNPMKRLPLTGTTKGVLLLANFSDTSTTHSGNTFSGLMNTTEYKSNGALGSVKDYYLEASYGQLTLQTDVHGWFPLPETHAYYGEDDPDPTKNAKDLNVRQMIEDAITAADPTVNFADYDSDGDRWVDMFGVAHQGLGQEVTGRDSNYIWSHRGSLSQAMTVDGVRIQHYYTVPELSDGSQLTTIGVFCHEIGHFLGLPDLYDYDRTSVGVGHWSIMASGSWLGPNGNGAKPCHFDAWCKYMLGWISPQIIYDPQSGVPLPGFDTHPTALLIPVDPYQDGEYFLVSNRYARATASAATGFDEYLPGSGALILHVDDYMPDNDDETRKKIDVEEADGLAFLDMSLAENNYNRGDPGDLYPNGASVFDDSTNPNSRDNDGIGTGIAVYNFTGAGTDTMACDVTPHAQLQGYTVLYDLMGNDRDYSRGYNDGDDYACVRFVSEQGGTLERVKTHFVYEGTTDYTVNVYSEWRGNGPAGLLTTQSGSHTGNSYEEIFLSEPQTFDKGAEFVIEIRYNTWGGYGWPLPVVDDGACSERTYVRSSSTAAYYQYTKANDRPYDALIRAGLRAPSPSGETAVKEYVCTHPPENIPDGSTLTWNLYIEDVGTITDLNVKLNVSHTRGSDLHVVLSRPPKLDVGQLSVVLSSGDGSWTDGDDTIFDDEAPMNDSTYRQPTGRLSAFDGDSITGPWILTITDRSRGQVGTLYSWSLIVELETDPEMVKLTASDGAPRDQFGCSVSISGDCAIVGAFLDDDNGNDSGSAYIFKRVGSSWTQQDKLIASDGAFRDYFGWSVSISGDYAIIGAFGDDDNGERSGSAYVFKRQGSRWVQQGKLVASDGTRMDSFGYSVSISGGYAIVGADDSAYIFKRDGSGWMQQDKLIASDGAYMDSFGFSVSLDGDYAVIGAHRDDDNGADSGSAYIFKRAGNSWTQEGKLIASDGAPKEWFGYSVSIRGDSAIIGARKDNDSGSESGSAYIFKRVGNSWTQQDKLIASDRVPYDRSDRSVSISGDSAIIGTPFDDGNVADSGSAYVFRRVGNSWTQQDKLTAWDGAADDYFGTEVSISGGYAIIGAPGDENGKSPGSAYIFRLSQIAD